MRYFILVLLNIPIITLALLNIITKYKMKRMSKRRMIRQVLFWVTISVVIVSSFPFYNYINNKPLLNSSELSLFDIVQTTVIVFLIHAFNSQRQKNEINEKLIRDLHQELSIVISNKL